MSHFLTMFLLSKGGRYMNEIYDVEIKNGYRLEKDLRHEKMLDLVLYQNGQRKIVDSVPSISINTYQDAWRFIEKEIGSSIKCDFAEDAVKMIFDK